MGTGTAVRFGVLGPIAVWRNEASVSTGHARQRHVLAALLVDAGKAVPTDVPVNRVWGEAAPRQGPDALCGRATPPSARTDHRPDQFAHPHVHRHDRLGGLLHEYRHAA
ncbi:AfsR/SARP family transcriptional regulator [Streptomyces sp. LZ34]